jgi:hypothetical protein
MWRNKAYELSGAPLPWNAEELIEKAVLAEREACAQIAKDWDKDHPNTNYGGCIAVAIRARGQK